MPSNRGQRSPNNEAIIAIMGATGSGKSTFINLVAGTQFAVGPGLKSCTKGVEVSPPFMFGGKRVTLVDTPGFDDTNLSDTEVLTLIALFLSQTFESGRLLNGIIFLHRISDFRVGGVTRRNFTMFRSLCGDESLKNVVIATNMWGQVSQEVGEAREMELASENMFFRPALEHGARMVRHDRSLETAQAILQALIDNQPTTLQIQRELVVEGKDISETQAGQKLNEELAAVTKRHREDLKKLQQDMSKAMMERDVQAKRELEQATRELMSKIRKNEEDRETMSAQFTRERDEMTRRVDALRSSLQQEAAARKMSDDKVAEAQESLRDQAAEMAVSRQRFEERIADIQRQRNSNNGGGGLMDFLFPVVTLIVRML